METGKLIQETKDILKQDMRIPQNLQEREMQSEEQASFYSIEQTQKELSIIDEVMKRSTEATIGVEVGEEYRLADEEKYRLKAIRGRNISHILMNKTKFGGDSQSMKMVKHTIQELEAYLATITDVKNIESITKLEAYYRDAIAQCQFYCDVKNPTFHTGKERKQLVSDTLQNLREEFHQVQVAKELVESGRWEEENITSVQQMFVKVQEHLAQANQVPVQEKREFSIEDLSYSDFTQMVGTNNRGQVEFAGKELKVINNSMLTSKTGKLSHDNFRVRYRFLKLAMEKLGDDLTPEIYARLSNVLELNSSDIEKKPLSRSVIKEVISYVNEVSSVVTKTLQKGEAASPLEYTLASAVNEMIGGEMDSQERIMVDVQEEKVLKAEITSIMEKAKKWGVPVPSLNKHQMDNLVKGNVAFLRDKVFGLVKQTYRIASHMNGGEALDYKAFVDNQGAMIKIAAATIARMAAVSQEGKHVAEFHLNNVIKDVAFEFAGKQGLREELDKSHVGELAVRGSAGLEREVGRRLSHSALSKEDAEKINAGTTKLMTLCDQMHLMTELQEKALQAGLTDDEAQVLKNTGVSIQQLLNNEANVADMEFVTKEMKGLRFASGLAQAKALVADGFSFAETTAKLAEMTTTNGRHGEVEGTPGEEAPQVASDEQAIREKQMSRLSSDAKVVASVLLLEEGASAYIQKSKKTFIQDCMNLHDVLRTFMDNQVNAKTIRFGKSTIQLVQKLDGTLDLIEGTHMVSIPCRIQMIADRMERDIANNVDAYGDESAHRIVRGLRLDEEGAGELVRGKELCLKIIEQKTRNGNRPGLPAAYFNNVPANVIKAFAEALLMGAISKEAIEAIVDQTENADLINGEEVLRLMSMMEEQQARVDQVVVIHAQEQKQTEKSKNDWTAEEVQMKNFISDLIFSQETWKADNVVEQPAERVRLMVLQHIDTVVLMIKKPALINKFLDKISMPGMEEGFIDVIREKVTEFREDMTMSLARAFVPKAKLKKYIQAMFMDPHPIILRKLVELDAEVERTITEGSESIQQVISEAANELFGNRQGEATEQQDAQQQQDANEQVDVIQEGAKRLNAIIESATRGEAGQGRFTKLVLQNYFADVSTIDKRSMFGSALRNMAPKESLPADASEEEVQQSKNKTMGTFLGGLLKGAGPLMHKMLQGLPQEGMPDILKEAIKDVRSNLAPIPESIVKEHLWSMVERSKGSIERIEMVRSLGAASVGQAFLCKIYGPGIPEEGQDVVVKLLRPDVRNRMMREKPIMLRCADQTDENHGMFATYSGQLKRIEEELDLSIEAANIEKGKIYDKAYDTVQAMKMNKLVEPTVNSLMLDRAPGETVDKFFDRLRNRQNELIEPFYKERYDDMGQERLANDKKYLELTMQNVEMYESHYSEMEALLEEAEKKQKYLLSLAHTWVTEGIYGEGFYHGDLHAGNLIVNDDKVTLIDFGNATKLTDEQQRNVMRMMAAAACGEVEGFRDGFHKLLENTDEAYYQTKLEDLNNAFREVLTLGDQRNTGQRILAALMKAQELGLELPSAIFNFSQSQMRLQNTIDEMNNIILDLRIGIHRMKNIEGKQTSMDFCNQLLYTYTTKSKEEYTNAYAELHDMSESEFEEKVMKAESDAEFEEIKQKMEKLYNSGKSSVDGIMKRIKLSSTENVNQQQLSAKTKSAKIPIRRMLEPICILAGQNEEQRYDNLVNNLKQSMDNYEKGVENYESAIKTIEKCLNDFLGIIDEKKKIFDNFMNNRRNKEGIIQKPDNMQEVFQVYQSAQMQAFYQKKSGTISSWRKDSPKETVNAMQKMLDDKEHMGEELTQITDTLQKMYDENSEIDIPKQRRLLIQTLRDIARQKMREFKGYSIEEHAPFTALNSFFNVMADVIMENKMSSLKKIGGLNAISYFFKM